MTKPIIPSAPNVENSLILNSDFSGKLPSSTPVASPRFITNSLKKEHASFLEDIPSEMNSKQRLSDSESSSKKSSSTNYPIPKPRKNLTVVSNSFGDPVMSRDGLGSGLLNDSSVDIPITIKSNQPAVQEGNNLYLRFLYEEIKTHNLEAPDYLKVPESDYSIALRHVANEFSNSSHRLQVRDQAESVQLENLSVEGFFELLDGLFKEGGVTYERVLVLFFFCTDITIRALRDNFVTCFNHLVNWTLKFFTENIFEWVQRNGGWACVLQKSMDFTYKAVLMITLSVATIALITYVRRK